eukprot:129122-Rhodomonas_salina.1
MGGSKPCVRTGLDHLGSGVTGPLGDAVVSGAGDDAKAFTQADMMRPVDGINYDRANTSPLCSEHTDPTSGPTGAGEARARGRWRDGDTRTQPQEGWMMGVDATAGGSRGLKREHEHMGTDTTAAMAWDEVPTLMVTPAGHDWGVQQAAARSLKTQLTLCSLAILHVDSGAGAVTGWLRLLLPDLHPPAMDHLDLVGLVARLPQLVAAAGLQVLLGVRTSQGQLRWQAAAGEGNPIAPIVLQVGATGGIEAVAAVGPVA